MLHAHPINVAPQSNSNLTKTTILSPTNCEETVLNPTMTRGSATSGGARILMLQCVPPPGCHETQWQSVDWQWSCGAPLKQCFPFRRVVGGYPMCVSIRQA